MASQKKSTKKIIAPGYQFAGIHCGIKDKKKKDLALMVSEVPAKVVACFTTNRVQAAPIHQGKDVIRNGRLQALVVNSGNANAITGKRGLNNSYRIAAVVAKSLGLSEKDVLVSSTGKIGAQLPMPGILKGIPKAVEKLSPEGLKQTAQAILTTDAFPKVCQRKGKIRGKSYTLTGVAKGAGMIEPHMATMLAYVFTDLDLPRPLMQRVFSQTVDETFNSISVDGDQSTNDTALLMANGVSGIRLASPSAPEFRTFQKQLQEVCETLAWMMVQDGEGATKVVEIRVKGAKNKGSARKIAYSIARSQLVKTSFFGEDPNWGRVFAAIGYSGETLNPSKVDIDYGPVPLVRRGLPTSLAQEAKAHRLMKKGHFSVKVNLNSGRGEARVFTSDLTYEYVKINAEYRT